MIKNIFIIKIVLERKKKSVVKDMMSCCGLEGSCGVREETCLFGSKKLEECRVLLSNITL